MSTYEVMVSTSRPPMRPPLGRWIKNGTRWPPSLAAFWPRMPLLCARAGGGAVVRGENENGVFGQSFFFEELPHGTDIIVDVGDHAVEVGEVHTLVLIRFAGSLRRVHGAVRRVGAEVYEEWFFAVFHLGDEALGVIKKDIGAKALRRHGFAVMKIGAIKVGVIPESGVWPTPPPPCRSTS